jgi:hypothetical protein
MVQYIADIQGNVQEIYIGQIIGDKDGCIWGSIWAIYKIIYG